MIDMVLGVLIMSMLIGIIKLIGFPIFKIFERRKRKLQDKFNKTYPIISCTPPLNCLERDDQITFEDGRVIIYDKKMKGSMHKVWDSVSDTDPYTTVSETELILAIKIVGKKGLKWQKE